MLPYSYPSSVNATTGRRQMVVYFLSSVSGLQRWVDYIPVKYTTSVPAKEASYDQAGYVAIEPLASIAGKQKFVDYMPVYVDSNASDAWKVDLDGYIPIGTSGGGGAALYLDFTSSTQTLDPRVSFSRASNATVTGSNGLIQYAPHNLLTYSEQFDNAAWVKTIATVSSNNTISPDGTTTADKFIPNVGSGSNLVEQSFTSVANTYTWSVYVKASGSQYVQLLWGSSQSTNYANFDVVNGTTGTSTATSSTITSVGNGWFRVSITSALAAFAGKVYVAVVSSSTSARAASYTGDGTSGIFLWGAQLEIGSTATTYNPTTVKNLLGYSEAFDNAAWTKTNSFVQTNLLTYSQDLDNAAWAKSTSSISANSSVAPDGTTTADKVVEDTSTGVHSVSRSGITVSSATSYTYTVYAKAGERNWIALQFTGGVSASHGAYFDLTNGVVGNILNSPTATSITPVGNGWYRCSVTATTTGTSLNLFAYLASANGTVSYAGNGTNGASIWGAQLVQGSVAGEYQATYAAATAVQYTAPNGTLTADKLVEDTATSTHRIDRASFTFSAAPYTASVYLKDAGRSWALVRFGASGLNINAYFNISTGTVGTVGAGVTSATITSVGNGWYRCSISGTATAVTDFGLVVFTASADGTVSYTGDGTSGIYIWGAQLSDSASVDTYVNNPVAAPSAAAYYGPRFDYDPVTLQPKGLLIEEQRTNLVTYSDDFSNTAWSATNSTVTSNSTVAPDGTLTADLLIPTTGSSTHVIRPASAITVSGSTGTHSIFVKASGYSRVGIRESSVTGNWATFNLSTGAVIGSSGMTNVGITSVGNGWYRLSATDSAATQRLTVYVLSDSYTSGNPDNHTFAGNGFSGIYIWGAQLEAGSFATSYIPTVASQVTRSADVALIQGSNFSGWYNQNEGSVHTDFTRLTLANSSQFSISDGTSNNYIQSVSSAGGTVEQGIIANGGTITFNYGPTTVQSGKLAIAYQANNSVGALNGTIGTTDTSVTIPVVNQFSIGNSTFNNRLNGHIKRISYFNRRISNTELQGITS